MYKLIYKIGVKLRNPTLVKKYKFLKETENWSLDKLNKYQFEKTKLFLQFAYEYSDYYKRVFDEVGFNPTIMKSLDDIRLIPVINKEILINYNKEIHTNYKFKKLRLSETSGTSGQVLKFFRNEEWDSAHRASIYRGYSWYGIKPWDKNGYFWGYNIASNLIIKTKFFDFFQNRFRLFSYELKAVNNFIEKLKKAKYIHGYSSMIYEVAKVINTNPNFSFYKKGNIKMIKGTSEKIFDSYKDEVYKAFGINIINEYGSAETGIIAYECPEGRNMHITMENLIVENIDNEIVVTNLLSKSFPIIRYKLGDYIELEKSNFKCSCGKQHPVIKSVMGRVGKKVYGKSTIYPSLTFYYVFKNIALGKGLNLNYQIIQEEKGVVNVKIEQNYPELKSLIISEFKKYFKNDLDIFIYFGVKLHSKKGKLKDFVSNIN